MKTSADTTTTTASPTDDQALTWVPCAICWGQRVIFENPNGEGLVPRTCPACLGVGERLAA